MTRRFSEDPPADDAAPVIPEADAVAAYARIEGLLGAWGDERGLAWLSSWAGRACRYAHFSNDADECYQITVDPDGEGTWRVGLYSVERWEKPDVAFVWKAVDDGALVEALEDAFDAGRRLGEPKPRRARRRPRKSRGTGGCG